MGTVSNLVNPNTCLPAPCLLSRSNKFPWTKPISGVFLSRSVTPIQRCHLARRSCVSASLTVLYASTLLILYCDNFVSTRRTPTVRSFVSSVFIRCFWCLFSLMELRMCKLLRMFVRCFFETWGWNFLSQDSQWYFTSPLVLFI